MTARALTPEARRAVVVEALADALVAEVRRLQAARARAGAPAANDTRPAPAVASGQS